MGNLARWLQQRFRDAYPTGWACAAEQRILGPKLERVYDSPSQAFALSTFCAFVPIHSRASNAPSALTMNVPICATLDESEARFDGSVAQRHLTIRLGMRAVPIGQVDLQIADRIRGWHSGVGSAIALHRLGPVLLLAMTASNSQEV